MQVVLDTGNNVIFVVLITSSLFMLRMQLAFDKLTVVNVAQMRTSALVSFRSVNSYMNSHFKCKQVLSWRKTLKALKYRQHSL